MKKIQVVVDAIEFTEKEKEWIKESSEYVHFDWHFRDDDEEIHTLAKKIVKQEMELINPTEREIELLKDYLNR